MAVVTIARLTKQYDKGEPAVRDFNLTVADGEFMVLLGPSGCGKSSVLRMIAGLEPITDGTVSIDSRVVNQVPAKDRDIAMVFQSYALYPHMTVHENLAFGLRRRGVARGEIDRRVRNVAGRLGLTPFLLRKPHALSGGQRQRVALGRAIVRQPRVFLFDEPLSNLDAALRVSTRTEIIRQQADIGTTTIYVTHDQIEAMTMGHRVCIMNAGRVVQTGRPLDVYRRPANTFVAKFLGNPPMNLLGTHIGSAGGTLLARVGAIVVPLPGLVKDATAIRDTATQGEAILGFRPEDVYDRPPPIAGAIRLSARIVAVEPLGAETLIVAVPEGQPEEIIARVGRDTTLVRGATNELWLDGSAVHVFDASSTEALRDRGDKT